MPRLRFTKYKGFKYKVPRVYGSRFKPPAFSSAGLVITALVRRQSFCDGRRCGKMTPSVTNNGGAHGSTALNDINQGLLGDHMEAADWKDQERIFQIIDHFAFCRCVCFRRKSGGKSRPPDTEHNRCCKLPRKIFGGMFEPRRFRCYAGRKTRMASADDNRVDSNRKSRKQRRAHSITRPTRNIAARNCAEALPVTALILSGGHRGVRLRA